MGWFDDFVDAASDVVSDVGSSIADAAEDVGSVAVDVAGSAGGYVGDAVGAVGSTVDTATGGLASDLFNAVDDTVFDSVDYITDGAVNIDFDDGRFSASVGIPGIATAGASIGEDGVTASSDTLIGSTDIGLTDQGFEFASSGGIDFGPLPYYDSHIEVGANGDVSINGHVQGTVPTPYGILSGEATAGFESTDQGWGASLDANGTLTTETGVTIGAGIQAGYAESGGNSQTTLGLEGSISEPGVGTIGGSVGYQSTTKDGVTVTTEHAEGHASGFGVTAQAGESYVGIDTPQGSASQFTSGYDISGPTIDTLGQLGNSLLGDGGITTPGAAGSMGGAGGDGRRDWRGGNRRDRLDGRRRPDDRRPDDRRPDDRRRHGRRRPDDRRRDALRRGAGARRRRAHGRRIRGGRRAGGRPVRAHRRPASAATTC